MHLNSYGVRNGTRSKFLSPEIAVQVAPYCLSFWYYMFGEHPGNFSVYTMSGNIHLNDYFFRSGSQDNKWNLVHLTIPMSAKKFQVHNFF